jgi:hypothetical protein
MSKPSHATRLLRYARGGRVLDQDSWYHSPAPDGLGAIKAVRSRISELERRGYVFEHRRRARGPMFEYVLVAEPQDEAVLEHTPAVALDEQLPLLAADAARVGHYDCWGA